MALLPLAAALLAQGLAPNALSPEGPASLHTVYLGPTSSAPARYEPPRVIVGWSVRVGEGGAGGPVALMTFSYGDTARHRGRTEVLPAGPGSHAFPAQIRLPYAAGIALYQEAGGHAIVHEHPAGSDAHRNHALNVWQPPLTEERPARSTERRQGQRLTIDVVSEVDVDADGYGDETQDENDLAISARAGRRRIRVRLHNRGTRPVARPRVLVRMHGAELRNPSRLSWFVKAPPRGFQTVKVHGGIPPGQSRSVLVRASRAGFRAQLVADSEGFDPTPSSVVVRGRSG